MVSRDNVIVNTQVRETSHVSSMYQDQVLFQLSSKPEETYQMADNFSLIVPSNYNILVTEIIIGL